MRRKFGRKTISLNLKIVNINQPRSLLQLEYQNHIHFVKQASVIGSEALLLPN